MKTITLFDNSLTVLQYSDHLKNKQRWCEIVEDVKQTSVNTNNFNHSTVFESVPTLHMNNEFNKFIYSDEIINFCSKKAHDIILPRDKKFSCVSMWATFIPPYGQLLPKEHDGVFYGSFFLHSPPDSGMIAFHNDVSDLYYSKFGNTIHNEFNHNIQILNMPEGGIYIVPSFLKTGTTTNMSEHTNIQINFVLDIIQK